MTAIDIPQPKLSFSKKVVIQIAALICMIGYTVYMFVSMGGFPFILVKTGIFAVQMQRYDVGIGALNTACDMSHGKWGCGTLSNMYDKGIGVQRDYETAKQLSLRACNGGNATGCNFVGYEIVRFPNPSVDAVNRGLAYYQRACDLNNAIGCRSLAVILSDGKLVAADFARSTVFFKRSCELGDMDGCVNYGLALRDGVGVAKDLTLANTTLDAACGNGHMQACDELGRLYIAVAEHPKDPQRALSLFQKACDGQFAQACVGVAYFYITGTIVPADQAKGNKLLESSCELGSADGCSNLGNLYADGLGVERNQGRAIQLFEKALEIEANHPAAVDGLVRTKPVGSGLRRYGMKY